MSYADNTAPSLSDIICGPCCQARIIAQANVHCPLCKDVFCYNCCKIHRMRPLSMKHPTILLHEMGASALRDVMRLINRQSIPTGTSKRFGPKKSPSEEGKIKTEYMDQLALFHDHETGDYEDEFFCPEHNVIYCQACGGDHVKCPNTCSLEATAGDIKETGALTDLISKYKRCNNFSTIMTDDRRKEKENLLTAKDDLLPEFRKFLQSSKNANKEGFDPDEKESEFIAKYEDSMKVVTSQEAECSKIQKATEKALEDLCAVVVQTSKPKYVKTYNRLMVRYTIYEKCLKKVYDEMRDYKFRFPTESFVASLPENLTTTDAARIARSQRRLPPFLSTDPVKCSQDKALQRNRSIKLWGLGIFARAGITALKCTSTSQLVTVNRSECEVRVFNESGWTFASFPLPSLPWDLALISDTNFTVTLPGEKKVLFCKTDYSNPKKIQLEKELDVQEECWGIEFLGDRYVGTFEPWTDKTSVKIFDSDGTVQVITKVNSDGKKIFRAPQHVVCDRNESKIYVSDAGLSAVFTLNFSGQILSIFTDSKMDHPTGMTLDLQGNLYVCSKSSKSILRIPYTSGSKATNILDQNDVISNPRALCFYSDLETILVACSGKAQLFRFRMSQS